MKALEKGSHYIFESYSGFTNQLVRAIFILELSLFYLWFISFYECVLWELFSPASPAATRFAERVPSKETSAHMKNEKMKWNEKWKMTTGSYTSCPGLLLVMHAHRVSATSVQLQELSGKTCFCYMGQSKSRISSSIKLRPNKYMHPWNFHLYVASILFV